MKKIRLLLTISIFFLRFHIYGQTESDTLESSSVSAFFGFDITSGNVEKKFIVSPGLMCGIFHKKGIYSGLYTSVKATDVKCSDYPYVDYYLELYNFGVFSGYKFTDKYSLNPTIIIFGGVGEILLNNKDGKTEYKDFYYIFRPSVGFEHKVVEYFTLHLNLNYQKFYRIDKLQGYTDDNFSGVGIGVSLLFGIK